MSKATKEFFERIGENPRMQFPELIDIFEFTQHYSIARVKWGKWKIFKEGAVERTLKRFKIAIKKEEMLEKLEEKKETVEV